MADQTPSLADVVLAAIEARHQTFFTAIPGVIQSFNRTTQIASVLPGIHDVHVDEQGDTISEPMVTLPNVPVVFVGSGPWRTTFPVSQGDRCLLIVSSVSIGEWLANQADTTDPVTRERNHISNAVAIVGLRDAKARLNQTPFDRMSVGHDTGATIEIEQNFVNVGGMGGEFALKGESFKSAMNTFVDALDTAIGAMADSPTQTGAATLLHTAALAFKSALASALASITKVK